MPRTSTATRTGTKSPVIRPKRPPKPPATTKRPTKPKTAPVTAQQSQDEGRIDSFREREFLTHWEKYAPEFGLRYDLKARAMPWAGTGRKFKADFIHEGTKTIVEIQGSGHQKSVKYIRDAQKLVMAQIAGWAVVQIPSTQIRRYVPLVKKLIEARGGTPDPIPTTPPISKPARSRKYRNPF